MTKSRKKCGECGETKPLSDFHRDRSRSDGRRSACKGCRRPQLRTWQRTNRELVAENSRRWREDNPERAAEHLRHSKEQNPEKVRARKALTGAVRDGMIIKPDSCERCGQEVENPFDLHGHHEDYNSPLDVEWLCRDCHVAEHMTPA